MEFLILDFIPTYHLIKDDINESNMLYQIQLLQLFNLKNYNESLLNEKINLLYTHLQSYSQIIQLIQLIKDKNPNIIIDNNTCFKILFSYDYFFTFIKCLYQIKNNNLISQNTYNELIKLIK